MVIRKGKLEQTLILDYNCKNINNNYKNIIKSNPFKTSHFIYLNSDIPLDNLMHLPLAITVFNKNDQNYFAGDIDSLLYMLNNIDINNLDPKAKLSIQNCKVDITYHKI